MTLKELQGMIKEELDSYMTEEEVTEVVNSDPRLHEGFKNRLQKLANIKG